jgi:hypothetical protein
MPEIVADNLSDAWSQTLALVNANPRKELSNLSVSVVEFNAADYERQHARALLDRLLEREECFSVSTVANTIFPGSIWAPDKPRETLYSRYLRIWPRITAHPQNRKGTYFYRLIAYPSFNGIPVNQLEFVITAFNTGVKRRSAFQCALYVPGLDSTRSPYQGFPCMQQLAFIPEGERGLRVVGFYPIQYLCQRAYGNYLGLINLGRFVAQEVGRDLKAMTCIALVAKIDQPRLARSFLEGTRDL